MASSTSPDGIVFPDASDPIAPLNAVFQDLAESVQTALDGRFPTTSYQFVDTLYFESSGTFTKADFPYLRAIRVKCVGGGGGGGGAEATGAGERSSGGGGGAGGYAESFILESSLSASETVSRGGGGAGGTGASNGSNGGVSLFGSLVFTFGGEGSLFIAAQALSGVIRRGGGGGVATAGDLTVRGAPGTLTFTGDSAGQVAPGNGGSSHFGGGGRADARNASSNGENGDTPGGGGAGAANVQNDGTNRSGGAGANGIVIIELFA